MSKSQRKPKRKMHVRWDVTAQRWITRNKLPNGTKLVLVRNKDKRQVRGDTMIHRHTLPPASGDVRVSQALDELKSVLITNIDARKQHMAMYAPDGSLVALQTLLSTVRKFPGLPTEEDKEQEELTDLGIDHIASSLREDLDLAEEAWGCDVVLRGYIRAMLAKSTASEIRAAITSETG